MRETESLWVGRRRTTTPPATTSRDHTTPKRLETPLTSAERWKAACHESAFANSIPVPRRRASRVTAARAAHDDAAAAASAVATTAAAAATAATAAVRQPLRWPDAACSGGGAAVDAQRATVSTHSTKLWYLQKEGSTLTDVEAVPTVHGGHRHGGHPPVPPQPTPWRSGAGFISDGDLLAARMHQLQVASHGMQARAHAPEEAAEARAADVGQREGSLQGALAREGALARWRASGAAGLGQGHGPDFGQGFEQMPPQQGVRPASMSPLGVGGPPPQQPQQQLQPLPSPPQQLSPPPPQPQPQGELDLLQTLLLQTPAADLLQLLLRPPAADALQPPLQAAQRELGLLQALLQGHGSEAADLAGVEEAEEAEQRRGVARGTGEAAAAGRCQLLEEALEEALREVRWHEDEGVARQRQLQAALAEAECVAELRRAECARTAESLAAERGVTQLFSP